MLAVKDVSAWISVDGKELPQHQTTVTEEVSNGENTHRVSCWIASEEGKEFSMHVKTTHGRNTGNHGFRFLFYTDGTYAGGRILRDSQAHEYECALSGFQSPGSNIIDSFLFSRLALTDDETALRDVSHLKDLGTVSIKVNRVAILGPSTSQYTHNIALDRGPIHERSKKAGAHCVSLGKARPAALLGPTLQCESLDEPLIIFEFRYRSADMLRAQGILPATIKDEPLVDFDLTISSLSPKRRVTKTAPGSSLPLGKVKQETDDEGDVDARIRALKMELQTLERKRNNESLSNEKGRPKKKVKPEPLNHANFADGEVIDLT